MGVVSKKGRSSDDNLCWLPDLALIPCYGCERVSKHLHQFEPSPKVPAPGALPLLIILTRTQHYNKGCHGSGKDQARFSSTIITKIHFKEILVLINSPLIEYWVGLEHSESILGWFYECSMLGVCKNVLFWLMRFGVAAVEATQAPVLAPKLWNSRDAKWESMRCNSEHAIWITSCMLTALWFIGW